MNTTTFDEAIPKLIGFLEERMGSAPVSEGVIVRDVQGRLCFFSNSECKNENDRSALEEGIASLLGPYARTDRPIAFKGDFGSERILTSLESAPIQVGKSVVRLIDRRLVGSTWVESETLERKTPARIVFATIKGGVGRSTALCVCAADLARRGKNVLILDLDLEAPGVGNLMLDEDAMPDYGIVDFLIEENSIITTQNIIGVSRLTDPSGGRVDVVPSFGKGATRHPENVIPKISKLHADESSENGGQLAKRINESIDKLTSASNYDVVLVDSRAGLAELAAPAIVGLGANVLLFGTAQKQTMEGYRSLFSALQILAQRDLYHDRSAEWRMMLKPVYAKSSMSSPNTRQFSTQFYELFSEFIYDMDSDEAPDPDALMFAEMDPGAPHAALTIAFSSSFIDFEPTIEPNQLTAPFYEQAYRPFLNGIDKIIKNSSGDNSANN